MSRRRDAAELIAETRTALHGRLRAVAPYIDPTIDPGLSASAILHRLALSCKRSADARHAWLLYIAVCAVYPRATQLRDLRRRLSLEAEGSAMMAVLESTVNSATLPDVGSRSLTIIDEGTVVDVNFCATFEHNTGIQRVVRQTMPIWEARGEDLTFVAWIHDSTGMRTLTEVERDRVLHWNDRRHSAPHRREQHATEPETVVVPWNSRVFLPEVPFDSLCSALACMAEFSGNAVSLIGYDAIPLVSADGQLNEESERFANYLTVIKHARSVAAISESAAEEFRGFCDALNSQGLDGPSVVTIPLAVELPDETPPDDSDHDRPMVLCVGSHEPRKNQEAVLHAAELLMGEGHDFEMVFVGGGSARVLHEFDRRVHELTKRGRRIRSMRRARDRELLELYRRARFTVFVSLHEGYGLPVAESLAHGTPVLTSNFGSLSEIARYGGCLVVDPRDDLAVIEGFRALLADDELIERLRAEAAAIVPRPWSTYATELWHFVRESKALVS